MATQYGAKSNWFATSWFGQFMASGLGRVVRIIGGGALIVGSLLWLDEPASYVVAAIGLIPLLAGAFDKCVLSALSGGPFSGAEIRALGRR